MTDYEKLKGIINEIDNLLDHHVLPTAPAFDGWYTKTERFLLNKYGSDSIEYKKFSDTLFSPPFVVLRNARNQVAMIADWCASGLRTCKAVFSVYLEEMDEVPQAISKTGTSQNTLNMNKIFIVHGHEGELKQSVARVIEKQAIEAVILSEQVNRGRTIIEKFEENADVGGAICLFTSDDLGRAKKATDDQPRARQNVVFEAGYFMGKLGRERVVFLADSGVEMPSDLSGIVYTSTGDWKVEMLKELRAMGYKVDFNKLF